MSNSKPPVYSIPPAGKVSALRQRMIADMTVRNLAPNTMLCDLKQVHYLARYFHKSPEQLSPEDIREYQLYLARDRKVSVNSRLVAMTALRFLYGVTLRRERFIEMLPMPRKEHYLPVILSPAEVLRFLEAAPSYSHRVIFSTMYGTGMRVSEALHLRMRHIDSQRMMIRIEQSKGNRDRDVPLSPKLLELLRTYWRKVRPQEWLFPGQNPGQPLRRAAVGQAVTQAARRAGLTKKPSPHCLRHASAYCTTFRSWFILKTIDLGRARFAGVYGRLAGPLSPVPVPPVAASHLSR
jgi:integrase/recombinase XerD